MSYVVIQESSAYPEMDFFISHGPDADNIHNIFVVRFATSASARTYYSMLRDLPGRLIYDETSTHFWYKE